MDAPVHDHCEFWRMSSPCEHLLEVYRSEAAFVRGLVEYASEGLSRGEAFVMVATAAHREAVAAGLRARGHAPDVLQDRFFALDAAETLASFMVGDLPDPRRFEAAIGPVLERASAGGRPVRAFGEMVVLLWLEDRREATLRLEQLWNRFLQQRPLTLLCAYPRREAGSAINDDFAEICAAHSQVAFT